MTSNRFRTFATRSPAFEPCENSPSTIAAVCSRGFVARAARKRAGWWRHFRPCRRAPHEIRLRYFRMHGGAAQTLTGPQGAMFKKTGIVEPA